MITRLESEDCLESNTIPVMGITIFRQMKARVIEAHCTLEILVIKKTDLLDFIDQQSRKQEYGYSACVPTSSKVLESPQFPRRLKKSSRKAGKVKTARGGTLRRIF
ncbi:hypothetical protein N7491_011264 [Penicillium cf. griseofulvum]|uniref:Uncharacterized protein n=1 Tax=Penicillium cf. griseofulvum TaxID=2972120 RepID=A0A9W9JM64_9EURO|nr:hypothetical protein N7472_004732 [Penicillium cf. griseofulvum]KAJ5416362.1 hypothetical protein N7491_011264 [Penicillium cf. griseofulvum]KAJ5442301.1 hypothetical protein N7445_005308 [Penicillium cf. griseofulvum]